MFFQLLKDLPLMFVIAAVIWLAAIFIAFKTLRNKKQKPALNKTASTIATFLTAVILTLVTVWMFIFFIPTHFKKNNTGQQAATISTNDIAKEIQTVDTSKISSKNLIGIDSLKKKKMEAAKVETKIYTTNNASIKFLSQGEDEDIEAANHQSAIALNSNTGDVKVIALIKGFEFDNQLMQDHFNSAEYMNSGAFPQTEFKGKITNIHQINFTANGTYNADVSGSLTIHGITKNVSAKSVLVVAAKKISVQSVFKIKRIDYGITTNEIADELQITVNGTLE